MKRRRVVLPLALILVACARSVEVRSEPNPRALDPVGTFDFQTSIDGTGYGGTITIVSTDAGYGGSVESDAGTATIRSVTVNGMTVNIATGGGADATLELVFSDNDTFTGGWSYAGMGGSLTGKRRR